jgi:hypothetical protein
METNIGTTEGWTKEQKKTLIEKYNVIIVLHTFQNLYFKTMMCKTFD